MQIERVATPLQENLALYIDNTSGYMKTGNDAVNGNAVTVSDWQSNVTLRCFVSVIGQEAPWYMYGKGEGVSV